MIKGLEISKGDHAHGGRFEYTRGDGIRCSAQFPLFLINAAWKAGCDLEDLADGFGQGCGTMNGDWSGIRDSSYGAIDRMLERAINFLELAV